MKRLFNEYEATTIDGDNLADEVEIFSMEIARRYADNGYSLRDIDSIMHSAVSCTTAYLIIDKASKKRKAERSNK